RRVRGLPHCGGHPSTLPRTGVAGFNHFGGELFKKIAGINMVIVPHKGGGAAMTDIIAGNIPVMFTSVTQVLAHVRAGRIRMLAVGSAKRSPALPDIPTVIESGFPCYEVAVWRGVSAPAHAPRPVLEKLRRAFDTIIGEAETQKLLAADAAETQTLTPAAFRKLIHDELVK
ncbi:MAG: tripartite tricarboxylate transporter substrate-binding protein, partial [Bradyrhizobium sp.]